MQNSLYVSIFFSLNLFLLFIFYSPVTYSFTYIYFCIGISATIFWLLIRQEFAFDSHNLWHNIYLLPLLLILAAPFIVMHSDDQLYVTKNFFSDHAKHNAVTGMLLEPNFIHPNPYVSGSSLWYYWISYIPGAIISKIFDLPVYHVNRLMPVFYAGIFLKTIHVYFSYYLNIKYTRYAVYTLIMLGGWDWLYFYIQNEPLNIFMSNQPDLIWEWPQNDFRIIVAYNIERSLLYLWPHVFSLSNLIMSVYVIQKQHQYWSLISAAFLTTSLLASSILAPAALCIFVCTALMLGVKGKFNKKTYIFNLLICLCIVFLLVIPFFLNLYIQKQKSLMSMEISLNPLLVDYYRGSEIIDQLKPFFILKYIFLEFGGSALACIILFRKKYWSKIPFVCAVIVISLFSFLCFRIFGRTDWSAKHSIFLQYSLSTLLIIYCLQHSKKWLRYVLVFFVMMSLPSTAMNIYAFINHKYYTAVYSKNHLQAEQWIRKNISRGKVFLAPPGNTFITVVLSRPLHIGDGHHSNLFFANRHKVESLLKWGNLKNKAEIIQFICEGQSINYFWFEPHEKAYLFLKDHFKTVYGNAAGTLLKTDCVE